MTDTLRAPDGLPPSQQPTLSVDDDTLTTSKDKKEEETEKRTSPTAPQNATTLDAAAIERLGRQRPETLKNALTEFLFVSVLVISMMMSEYYISGFTIILPSVANTLDIPDSLRTWPAAVPNLSTAALLLPFSRLGDIYGAKVVFLCGHGWTLIWSLACGFAQEGTMLIIFRALQGVGFAAFLPTGLTLLAQTYRPGPRKNFMFSLYGSFAALGFYFGILIGAVAAELLTWRWYFWIGCFLLGGVIVVGALTIPGSVDTVVKGAKMDWWGLGTIVPGLALVVFAFTDGGHAPDGWKTPSIYVTFIIGVLFLIAAVYVQGWVSKQPLMPAEMFKHKYMKRIVAMLFCCYGIFGLYLFYASYYLETVLDATPILTAVWYTPMAVGGIILSILGGLILHVLSGKILMTISNIGFILAPLLFAIMPAQDDNNSPSRVSLYWAYIFPAMICATIGIDITYTVANIFITTAMPSRHQGAAGGLINSLVYLGIAFWLGIGEMAVATRVKDEAASGTDLDPRSQYRIAFWLATALGGVAMIIMAFVKLGKQSSDLTADERAELAKELEEREGGSSPE